MCIFLVADNNLQHSIDNAEEKLRTLTMNTRAPQHLQNVSTIIFYFLL